MVYNDAIQRNAGRMLGEDYEKHIKIVHCYPLCRRNSSDENTEQRLKQKMKLANAGHHCAMFVVGLDGLL